MKNNYQTMTMIQNQTTHPLLGLYIRYLTFIERLVTGTSLFSMTNRPQLYYDEKNTSSVPGISCENESSHTTNS